MESIRFAEQKVSLAQTILALNDINKISQIQLYVDNLLNKKQMIDNEFDATKQIFSEWNKQFENADLDEYISDYGTTLREFRMKIYNAEKEKGMTKQEFLQKVNSWK